MAPKPKMDYEVEDKSQTKGCATQKSYMNKTELVKCLEKLELLEIFNHIHYSLSDMKAHVLLRELQVEQS